MIAASPKFLHSPKNYSEAVEDKKPIKFTKTKIGLAKDPWLAEGFVTPSERWGVYTVLRNGKTSWAVAHLPTGMTARFGMTYKQARLLAEAAEGVTTLYLDAVPFGELAETNGQKDDLRKLAKVMIDMLTEGTIR